jgi:CRP-like cAMP-binding protein
MAAAKRPRRKAPSKPALRMSALLGLQKVDLFKGLDSYTLREIAAQCKWTRCKRNQVVIHRDGMDRDVYFVIAGQVRVTAEAGRGRRIILRELAAGEVFGEHSAIDGRARFADALALRESLLASMSPEAFREDAPILRTFNHQPGPHLDDSWFRHRGEKRWRIASQPLGRCAVEDCLVAGKLRRRVNHACVAGPSSTRRGWETMKGLSEKTALLRGPAAWLTRAGAHRARLSAATVPKAAFPRNVCVNAHG